MFRRTLGNERNARDRLETVMYTAIRDTNGQHDRTDLIGWGCPFRKFRAGAVYESLIDTRNCIGEVVVVRMACPLTDQQRGIEIVSADIRRAKSPLPCAVGDHRPAFGEEEYLKRTADVQKHAGILVSQAERETHGEGGAEAIRIVQDALLKALEFYDFLRLSEATSVWCQTGTCWS